MAYIPPVYIKEKGGNGPPFGKGQIERVWRKKAVSCK